MTRTPPVDLRPYFLTRDDLEGPIDWTRLFGNNHPVELDVGSGRGLFLVTAGLEHPDVNYLGIELDFKEGRRAARRLQKREMPNVRVLGGDARFALEWLIEPESVSAAHVYFPDPWWKKKHKRRRIFTDEFATQLAHVLMPRGEVHSWTDVEDYFTVIEALMDHNPAFEKLAPPAEHEARHDLDFRTSFERRKRQLGAEIHRGRWRKR